MNTIRVTTRRAEEDIVNKGVPPQSPQGDQVPQVNQVSIDSPALTNEEFRLALLMKAQVVTAQAQAMTS